MDVSTTAPYNAARAFGGHIEATEGDGALAGDIAMKQIDELAVPVASDNLDDSVPVFSRRVAVVDLADELQVRKQRIFKVVAKLGIRTVQRRESARGNQFIATVSAAEAARVRDYLIHTAVGTNGGDDFGGGASVVSDDVGLFYLLLLEPELDPGRFKVGFTTDLDGRIRKHRCSAPFTQTVATWPCRRTWERTAIDCVTIASEQLYTEVFRTAALDSVVARGTAFFDLMPTLGDTDEEGDDVDSAK